MDARSFTGLVLLGAFVAGITRANTVSVTAGVESEAVVKDNKGESRKKLIACDGGFNLNAGSSKLEKSKK